MIFAVPKLPPTYLKIIEIIGDIRKDLNYATSDNLHRWYGPLARTTAARAMVGTNSIEGINVTLDDAVAVVDGEAPQSAQEEDLAALRGYWSAMTYIVQLSKDQTYIHNENTIKSLHYMMLGYDLGKNPGRWRPGHIHVTNTATNQVVYEGPDVQLVPGFMGELVAFLNTANEHPLVKAAMAHLNLTMIHPFSDGNGRMARALQTMVLSREGILDPRFSSIEEYVGRHSADYYAVLAEVGKGSWHPENNALPWIKFCLTAHYRQARNLLRRLSDMGRMWNALEEEAKKHKLNERVVFALADAAIGLKVKNPAYRNAAQVSNQVAKYDLKALADAGLLIPKGERRGRYYIASKRVEEIRAATRSPSINADPFEEMEKAEASIQQPELPLAPA